MSEFASIEEELNGIEKYAMYFLEEETADIAAEQIRLAEVYSCIIIFLNISAGLQACKFNVIVDQKLGIISSDTGTHHACIPLLLLHRGR